MAEKIYEKLQKCLEIVREKTDFKPTVALTLGSGLGDYADHIQVETLIDYREIPDFPVSTAPGHKGRYVFGYVGEVPVVLMQGRTHYYEGYSIYDTVLPVRLMGVMGAGYLMLTNAAGGINYDFKPGDLMMIKDQISDFVPSPLVGENIEPLGPRFPDMSEIYDRGLQSIIQEEAAALNIPLKKGIYLQFTGPNYESPAEIRMARALGADAVGMSTACEAIAARHMGLKICGISCITNMGCGLTDRKLTASEVIETADRIAPIFRGLVTGVIKKVGQKEASPGPSKR